jgi:hypothetical protein
MSQTDLFFQAEANELECESEVALRANISEIRVHRGCLQQTDWMCCITLSQQDVRRGRILGPLIGQVPGVTGLKALFGNTYIAPQTVLSTSNAIVSCARLN